MSRMYWKRCINALVRAHPSHLRQGNMQHFKNAFLDIRYCAFSIVTGGFLGDLTKNTQISKTMPSYAQEKEDRKTFPLEREAVFSCHGRVRVLSLLSEVT